MSGPNRRKRRKRSQLSRRGFLGSLAAVAAACGDNIKPGNPAADAPLGDGGVDGANTDALTDAAVDGATQSASPFVHGVASGDPLADRVVLWTRITTELAGPIAVHHVVATDAAFTQIVVEGDSLAEAAHDFTVKVDRDGLAAGTTYYYRFTALGHTSMIGRTRTLPAGQVDRLRIGVVSCASYAHGLFNAYRRVAARADLDLVVHVGDYLYEYSSGSDGKEVYGTARMYEPTTEVNSLADYRIRYAQYHRDEDLQELHRQHAMINIWDDHELANDSWTGGAGNHNEPSFQEGMWATRVSAALQAFYEWVPIRPVSADPKIGYRTFALGNLADLVMLESRVAGRSQPITPAIAAPPPLPPELRLFGDNGTTAQPARTLLGTTQEAWVETQLKSSTAKWRLVGQGVMMGQLKAVGGANALGTSLYLNPDQWDGYPRARDRFFDVIEDNAIDNVVVLTGDIHSAWALDLTRDPNNGLAYNANTGAGSLAVELVATSVTSPGLAALSAVSGVISLNNPHIKYVNLTRNGYMLLDVTPERLVGEHWYVDTIATASTVEMFGAAYATLDGVNHLAVTTQTQPRANPPPLAP